MSCVTNSLLRQDVAEESMAADFAGGNCRIARFALGGCNFNIGVGVAPQEGHAGEPILCVNELAYAGKFRRRQETCSRRKFRADDFSADCGGRNCHLWVVADALAFSGFAVRHEVEFVVVLREPDRRGDGDAVFSDSCQTDVALTLDFWGDIGHENIVARQRWLGLHGNSTLKIDCWCA